MENGHKEIEMEAGWLARLQGEFDKQYMRNLGEFLRQERRNGKVIFPPNRQIFNAFNFTPFDEVKVVILGQDPYHGEGQAHGLCFSVKDGVRPPPSLVNIYKELARDTNFVVPKGGDLTKWARQGVLLLNSVLTVEAHIAASHQGRGWEDFTDFAIKQLAEEREGLVFMLWGSYAQKKGAFIDKKRHLVLQAPHPSPLSAHRGFFGCGHFSKVNEYLAERGLAPIDWQV